MEERTPGEARYRAFVSYSHRDQAFGRRLHRWLERYAVPRRLVGRVTARGTTPKRVAPVFRDREELSAAHDLTAEIREALANSGALIVVCTPNAAASPWVAREIELFRELHPDRPVLAALADGEPAEAFPAPLTMTGDARAEPLAADFRQTGDGPRLALLKLVAGVLGLGLDELIQRDAQRRLRGVMAVTGAAVAAGVVLSALTTYALIARAEAQRQRAEAEALVEFMLTDLRDRLKGVGRLDVLTAVNERTLAYYARQDLNRLPSASLERRARALHAMGEDEERRGDLDQSLAHFKEAARTTEALLSAQPQKEEWIFSHAQSEYYVAMIAYRKGDLPTAKAGFIRYRELSQRLVDASPDDVRYMRELSYAEGNLCSAELSKPKNPRRAIQHCKSALAAMQTAVSHSSNDSRLIKDLANRQAWLADAYMADGRLAEALGHRRAQEHLLASLMKNEPQNMELKEAWVTLLRAYAGIAFARGDTNSAKEKLLEARLMTIEMIAFDPENNSLVTLRRRIERTISHIESNARGGRI